MLKYCLSLICCLLLITGLFAQNNAESPDVLKKRMSDIRNTTNWNNPAEAKRANDSIKVLSKRLSKIYQQQNAPSDETEEQKSIREQNQDYKDKLWDQIVKSAGQGEGADILLGEPVKEEIKEIFELQEDGKKNRNSDFFEEMNFLYLDMSYDYVDNIIEVMQNFKSVKTLVITGGKHMQPADLMTIFIKASNYPLQELYIINFGNTLPEVPSSIFFYKDLTFLSLVNNSITVLPSLTSLPRLRTLYVDMNPLNSIISSISSLQQLEKLGIAKTGISAAEKTSIQQLLPNCEIEQP